MAERISRQRRHQSSKPQLERQRRARINNSLDELKSLVFSALYQDPDQYSQKMEKAEILEMTVNYLKMLRSQKISGREWVNDRISDALCKYRAGFNDCTNRVIQFLKNEKEVDLRLKENLLTHLASCCQFLQASSEPAPIYPRSASQCITMPRGVEKYYSINTAPYWPPTPPPSPTQNASIGVTTNEMSFKGSGTSNETHGSLCGGAHAQIWRPW